MCDAAWARALGLSSSMTYRTLLFLSFSSLRGWVLNEKMLKEESKPHTYSSVLFLVCSANDHRLCSLSSYSSTFKVDENCNQPFPSFLSVLFEEWCLGPPLWGDKHLHFSGAAQLLSGHRPWSKWQNIFLIKRICQRNALMSQAAEEFCLSQHLQCAAAVICCCSHRSDTATWLCWLFHAFREVRSAASAPQNCALAQKGPGSAPAHLPSPSEVYVPILLRWLAAWRPQI